MQRQSARSSIATILALVLLSGCIPAVIQTAHEYVLVQAQDGRLVIVEDDDPFYERVNSEIFGDPYVHSLLTLYEDATEAFLATNKLNPLSQTLANKPIIIVGSSETGALRNVRAYYDEEEIPIELGLGLAQGGDDLRAAQRDFPAAVAEVLVQIMGLKPPREEAGPSAPAAHEATTEALAFHRGFALALEALYGESHPEWLETLRGSSEERMRSAQIEPLPHNGFRFRFEGDLPTEELRPKAELPATPGVVGAFLYRLLKTTGDFYPQRHMLWMTNFEDEATPYAKVLLAMNRMPHKGEASIQAFVASYVETFPAERASVLTLAAEVLGGEFGPVVMR